MREKLKTDGETAAPQASAPSAAVQSELSEPVTVPSVETKRHRRAARRKQRVKQKQAELAAAAEAAKSVEKPNDPQTVDTSKSLKEEVGAATEVVEPKVDQEPEVLTEEDIAFEKELAEFRRRLEESSWLHLMKTQYK